MTTPEQPAPTNTEIATFVSDVPLQPRDLGEAMTLSKVLATSNLVPYTLRGKPADILLIMMYGVEMGLAVNQALRGINVIKGRPSLSTELRVAKTRERGHRVGVACVQCRLMADDGNHRGEGGHPFEPDWTQERCTVIAVRKDTGETAVVTWTIQDAVKARLLTVGRKGTEFEGQLIARSDKNEALPWETYTRDMLYNRAADRACKQIAPEVAYGLYTAEEIEHMPEEGTVPVTATVGQPVVDPIDPDQARADAAALQDQFQGGTR